MSYILDALKKSDNQRRQGEIPDLQTVHLSALDEVQSNRWLYVIIVLLLIGMAFMIGIYQPWNQPKHVSEHEKNIVIKKQAETPKVVKTQKNLNGNVAVKNPKVLPVIKTIKPAIITEKNKPTETTADLFINQQAIRKVPRLSELSPIVQQAIPNMIFAGHVYSSSSAQRSIIINGYAMSENDVVIAGLKVKQITRDGVIFDYQGQLFRVEILQDWSFD